MSIDMTRPIATAHCSICGEENDLFSTLMLCGKCISRFRSEMLSSTALTLNELVQEFNELVHELVQEFNEIIVELKKFAGY